MQNRWDATEAKDFSSTDLDLRVYTSRLLGREPELVLHGGGNTSVKVSGKDFFGEDTELIYVKGSGWDLQTIEAPGFSPCKMDVLLKLAELETLSDSDMVNQLRAGMTDSSAPTPSIEAILHAVIPKKFVDHTHANAIIALTNAPNGEERIKEIYGDRVVIVPYIMPGFILAKKVYELTRDADWDKLDGMVLLNHGIFSFHDDGKTSYDLMVKLVSEAEAYLKANGAGPDYATAKAEDDPLGLATLRKQVCQARGNAMICNWDRSDEAAGYSMLNDIDAIATRGPLTPDHVIRTKRVPVVVGDDPEKAVHDFKEDYERYFKEHSDASLTMLDPAPRWAVWKGKGTVTFGDTVKAANIVSDVTHHTYRTIQQAEKLGGWQALPESDLFEIEYWELEQAKLKKNAATPPLQGMVAIVTGAAGGIGLACANALQEAGAVVVGTDINDDIKKEFNAPDRLGLVCDVTKEEEIKNTVEETVRTFGGLDIVVSNAGVFGAGETIDNLSQHKWALGLSVNLTGAQLLLKHAIPYLKQGVNASVIIMASRNVNAPGPGAAAYSVPKAGLTQLARVAALELAQDSIRVNVIHPDAVFDTALWTPEALARSAERYGMTVDEYKRKNLMKTEITSKDVGRMVATVAGPAFSKTTGAQVPIDGGNDRII